MTEIKALTFNEYGAPQEVLSLSAYEKPGPKEHEVLIKVQAAPIHPADTFFIQGTYRFKPSFPQVAGLEGAGIVAEIGDHVNLPIGGLVSFTSSGTGAWGEYVIVREENIIRLPDAFPVEKAAQFYLNPFTAWGLLDEAKVNEGDWLLLTAANAVVSKIVIQLAHIRNIRTIAVVRDLQQSESLKALGATEVLEQDDDLADKVNKITSGIGVHAALDAVGGTTGTKILQSMTAGGQVILYGLLSNEQVQFHNSLVIYKNLHIKGFGIRGYLDQQTDQQRKEMIRKLISIMADTSFQLPVEKSFPLEQFKEAFTADAQRGRKGKILFTPFSK